MLYAYGLVKRIVIIINSGKIVVLPYHLWGLAPTLIYFFLFYGIIALIYPFRIGESRFYGDVLANVNYTFEFSTCVNVDDGCV